MKVNAICELGIPELDEVSLALDLSLLQLQE
jgi:hypothetical protein